ncbi:MAG: hypothetical protein J6D46_02870, partial [Lachnospiraceae bacterium]|nr:hypothetical protein [Lachnospiraceae bacterium]
MAKASKTIRARLHFIEEVLGTASANKELHSEYIASKAPDAKKREDEVAAIFKLVGYEFKRGEFFDRVPYVLDEYRIGIIEYGYLGRCGTGVDSEESHTG